MKIHSILTTQSIGNPVYVSGSRQTACRHRSLLKVRQPSTYFHPPQPLTPAPLLNKLENLDTFLINLKVQETYSRFDVLKAFVLACVLS